MEHDEDQVLPRVCDESRLPAHVRQPQSTLQRQLHSYPALKESMRSTIEPALLMRNDQAFSKALDRVLRAHGLDRRQATAVAVEPAPGPQGGIVIGFGGNPFRWLMRLFRRGGS